MRKNACEDAYEFSIIGFPMEVQELLALNAEGFIPGPGETPEDFRKRVFETREFFHAQADALPSHHWQWPSEQLKTLFDFSPRWCAAICSSKGLAPWQAAATWIDVKRVYLIRLRSARWVSWMIDRDEVLAHEAAHAARAAFDESKYEEFFAFLTSASKWRRVFGPLFRKPGEATLLAALFGMYSVMQMFELIWDINLLSQVWLFGALSIFCMWSLRLIRTRLRIERAGKRVLHFLKDPAMVRPVLFRMTDTEIEQLAGHLPFHPGSDLRWQLIKTAYWKEKNDEAH